MIRKNQSPYFNDGFKDSNIKVRLGLIMVVLPVIMGVLSGKAQGEDQMQSNTWKLMVDQGCIQSFQYDAEHTQSFTHELVFQPIGFSDDHLPIPLKNDFISLPDDGQALKIEFPNFQGKVHLRWVIHLSPHGYYDRLTRTSLENPNPDAPALHRFIAGFRGQVVPIEAFKRVPVELLNRRGVALWTLGDQNGSTFQIETSLGSSFSLDCGKGGSIWFSFENDFLVATMVSYTGCFIFRPLGSSYQLTLENGSRLPSFKFGKDQVLQNSHGGKTSLNQLVNEFFLQAAFWYPAGHGISAWAAWGPTGHAYMDSPYRIDSRNALMGQVIGDDGYGQDGLAYAWGKDPGWPFPGGHDTRHFGINAMHIQGVRTYLTWTGEKEIVNGIDFSIRLAHHKTISLDQPFSDHNLALARNHTYSQTFEAPQPFDRIDLHLFIEAFDPQTANDGIIDSTDQPAGVNHPRKTPSRLSETAGKCLMQKVTPSAPFNTLGVLFCNWGEKGHGARIRLFPWMGDVEKSLAGNSLAESVLSSVPDNSYGYVNLEHPQPAGVPLWVVVDQPTSPNPDLDNQTGVWLIQMDSETTGDCCLTAEGELSGLAMSIQTGIRLYHEASLRLVQGRETLLGEWDVRFPSLDGYWSLTLPSEYPVGSYRIELTNKGRSMVWKASHVKTHLGGQAACDGRKWNWLDRARRLMAYQLDILNASREKLLMLDGKAGDQDHLGLHHQSVGNHYYDILPFGYLEAYGNAWFYGSLLAMADLEELFGDPAAADSYRSLAQETRARYNQVFWTEKGHQDGVPRYVGCIDVEGVSHDYGFTFVNTLAIDSGLTSSDQAEKILKWLDEGVTLAPDSIPRQDIYHFRFAPRCTTIDNPDWWAVQQTYESYPWGDQIQNGGAVLHESYYDLRSRLKTRGVADAWNRFLDILQRYAEPDRLCGGSPLITGESVQGYGKPGAVGIMSSEFPETSLLAGILVYGFLGAEAIIDGLKLTPGLPPDQPSFQVDNLYYHGSYFHIRVEPERIRIESEPKEKRFDYQINQVVHHPPFVWENDWKPGQTILIVPVRSEL